MLLSKIMSTKKLDYVDLIINDLNKRRVGGFDRAYMGIHIWGIQLSRDQGIGLNRYQKWTKRLVREKKSEYSGKDTVCTYFPNNKLWKCIGCIILAVIYRNKGYRIWESNTRKYLGKEKYKIERYLLGKTDLLKLCCSINNFNCIFLYHWTILSYTNSLTYWILLCVHTSISFTGLWCLLDKVQ